MALAPAGAARAATADPSTLDFGSVHVGTASASQTVTFTPTPLPPSPLTTSEPVFSSPDFKKTGGTCPPANTIPPATSCTVVVTFTPSAKGTRDATLTYSDATVSLKGVGTQAEAALTPSSVAFPDQTTGTTSAEQDFTLSNTGNEALQVTAIAATGDTGDFNPFAKAGCPNPLTLAPGTSCTFGALFTPQAAGPRSVTIAFSHNGAGGTATVTLTGNGVVPSTPSPQPQPAPQPPPSTIDNGPGGGSTANGLPLISITAPRAGSSVTRSRKVRRGKKLVTVNRAVSFKGLASDKDGLSRVELALTTGSGSKCTVFDGKRAMVKGSCTSPAFFRARLDDFAWSFAVPTTAKLAPGTYTLQARATDLKGNRGAVVSVTFRIR